MTPIIRHGSRPWPSIGPQWPNAIAVDQVWMAVVGSHAGSADIRVGAGIENGACPSVVPPGCLYRHLGVFFNLSRRRSLPFDKSPVCNLALNALGHNLLFLHSRQAPEA